MFLTHAVCLWLALAPALTADGPGPVLLPAVAELVELKGVSLLSAKVLPLRRRVELEVQGSPELAARSLNRRSRLCPKATVEEGKVILACTTGRLEARPATLGAVKYLDLAQTRGVPLVSGRESLALPAVSWWKPTQMAGCTEGPQQEGSACAAAT